MEFMTWGFEAITKALDINRTERPTWSWHHNDHSVDFWFRRMAHETVIHRIDAEQAVSTVSKIDEVFALDDSTIIEHHKIAGYDSAEIRDLVERENIFFEVKGTAVIMHEEHGPITLDEGIYLRTVQRQYNPFSEALERVRD
jgi:hypothetical protein